MKYKVLITGKNESVIDGFFAQMSDHFEILSTSIRFEDMIRHMSYFVPDVFVCCLYKETQDHINKTAGIKRRLSQINVPFVVIGNREDCARFEAGAPRVSDLTLCLPLEANVIAGEIIKLIQKAKGIGANVSAAKPAAPAGTTNVSAAKPTAPAGTANVSAAKPAAPAGTANVSAAKPTAPAGTTNVSAAKPTAPAGTANVSAAKPAAPAGTTNVSAAKPAAPAGTANVSAAKPTAPAGNVSVSSAKPITSTGNTGMGYSAVPRTVSKRDLSAGLIKEALTSDEAYAEMLDALERHLTMLETGATRRKHVLIVDDDAMMLKLMKEYLHEKYDVATALNGKIALKFLERKKTDLILLDFEMPGESGPVVLEQLRASVDTRNIPVIFLTGVTEGRKIQEALALKPHSYLLKPIQRGKLIEEIRKVIG